MATSYLLYYAGMAEDKVTEQIGLATSADGIVFERVPPDGLVLRRDRAVPWRDLRVCNPTVLPAAGELVMLYQGISESLQVSIGRATSADGRTWACDREPSLPWEQMRELAGVRGPAQRTAVFEPSVLLENGRYRMWFLYLGAGHESHSLFYAESPTGESWEIQPEPLLTGRRFGLCLLHYPQVLRDGNRYRLYFTLRSLRSGVDAIYRMHSPDGLSWDGLETVLARWELQVARSCPGLAGKVAGRLVRPVDRLLARGPYRNVELGAVGRFGSLGQLLRRRPVCRAGAEGTNILVMVGRPRVPRVRRLVAGAGRAALRYAGEQNRPRLQLERARIVDGG